MKNFDYDFFESINFINVPPEWGAMCERCHQEYLLCKSHISGKFAKWYENGRFHDAILKGVHPFTEKNGKWTIEIVLGSPDPTCSVEWVLCYQGVRNFSIRKEKDTPFDCYPESCLYDEFYRTDDNERIVHEFFTTEPSFFCIEFSKLTWKERPLLEKSRKHLLSFRKKS